jgi:hypothetical protein
MQLYHLVMGRNCHQTSVLKYSVFRLKLACLQPASFKQNALYIVIKYDVSGDFNVSGLLQVSCSHIQQHRHSC